MEATRDLVSLITRSLGIAAESLRTRLQAREQRRKMREGRSHVRYKLEGGQVVQEKRGGTAPFWIDRLPIVVQLNDYEVFHHAGCSMLYQLTTRWWKPDAAALTIGTA